MLNWSSVAGRGQRAGWLVCGEASRKQNTAAINIGLYQPPQLFHHHHHHHHHRTPQETVYFASQTPVVVTPFLSGSHLPFHPFFRANVRSLPWCSAACRERARAYCSCPRDLPHQRQLEQNTSLSVSTPAFFPRWPTHGNSICTPTACDVFDHGQQESTSRQRTQCH